MADKVYECETCLDDPMACACTDCEDCWVGEDPDIFMNNCYCGVYPSEAYPNGACHLHGTCAGGPNCDQSCL